MLSFTCGGNDYFRFDFFFFTTLLSSLPCRSSYGRRHKTWSNVLKYSVLAHAHVLQKLVMNVNNAKAIKIILDLIRSNAIPCPSGCFVGVRSVKHQKCQISRVPQALMLKLNWKRLTKIKLRL